MSAGRTSRLAVGIGGALIAAGLVGAVVILLLGQRRADDAVVTLARAPVGCDTTLDFSGTGSFVVYVETAGRLERLRGGCDGPSTYVRRDAATPQVDVELTGPDGRAIALGPTEAADYRRAGFAGIATGEVHIDESGRHVMRVTATSDDVVVAIGRDLSGVTGAFRMGALLVGLAGVVAGATLIAIAVARGRGRPDELPAPMAVAPFVPDGHVPIAPPLLPPPPGSLGTPPAQPTDPWGPGGSTSAAHPSAAHPGDDGGDERWAPPG